MNKHFEDAQYYLKRAGETAKKGVEEELDEVRERFDEMIGGESEPEPSRVQAVRNDLETLQATAEGEAKEAITEARETIAAYRDERTD
ncbi:hypothetical protein Hrd1104_05560 [Halorhabdus sp. CBA1104]|uniref:DUF7553 family protein n=1 Tax=unclassified Halorhabdus TaxID=2621901 RepID=UPI0012B26641|nr:MULTISPECIES: hypothetical protein [unclassified Halorhabdus]QGN06812.1 hypothetical protein Hrd1104_05560 [Halorhabdus sp. CBA1104]